MGAVASEITSLASVTQSFIQAPIKETIKAPRLWPLCGEFTRDGEFPAQMASNAENVFHLMTSSCFLAYKWLSKRFWPVDLMQNGRRNSAFDHCHHNKLTPEKDENCHIALIQYRGCRWPWNVRCQATNSNIMDIGCREYFVFSVRRVNSRHFIIKIPCLLIPPNS